MKNNPPLIIDPDRMFPGKAASQRFKTIAGGAARSLSSAALFN
jgi:hypothetical protein